MTYYVAGASWLNQIVRALRGEAASEEWSGEDLVRERPSCAI